MPLIHLIDLRIKHLDHICATFKAVSELLLSESLTLCTDSTIELYKATYASSDKNDANLSIEAEKWQKEDPLFSSYQNEPKNGLMKKF